MILEDNGLYETRDGRRFRVKKDGNRFVCPKSFTSSWNRVGTCEDPYDDLVRKVDESRWISVCGLSKFEYEAEEGAIYTVVNGHVQRCVTREYAQRLAKLRRGEVRESDNSPLQDGNLVEVEGMAFKVVRFSAGKVVLFQQ